MAKFSHTIPLAATLLATVGILGVSVASGRVRRSELVELAPTVVRTPAVDATNDAALTLVVAREGNRARYQVQEQLVGFKLPSLAIGETRTISGSISIDSAGRVVRPASEIVVDVRGLRSDSDRRDGYVRSRILETEQFPTVRFTPTSVSGLTYPLPTTGTRTFGLVGNLTIHGVTRPATWQVHGKFDGDRISGVASTTFTFAEFGLTQPRVPVVLSVDDSIQLYYDFVLLHEAP